MGRGKVERRGARPRRIRPIVLIITEGEKSEAAYFAHFRTRQNNVDIRVVPNSKNGGKTDYMSLIRKASRISKDDDLSLTSGDSLWIVADGDVNDQTKDAVGKKNEALTKARAAAKKASFSLLISNPCFELWYLLHLCYTSAYLPDFDAVRKALEQSGVRDYEKRDDLYDRLAAHTDEAIARARALETHHARQGRALPLGIDANPFTEVYKLVERLVGSAQPDR